MCKDAILFLTSKKLQQHSELMIKNGTKHNSLRRTLLFRPMCYEAFLGITPVISTYVLHWAVWESDSSTAQCYWWRVKFPKMAQSANTNKVQKYQIFFLAIFLVYTYMVILLSLVFLKETLHIHIYQSLSITNHIPSVPVCTFSLLSYITPNISGVWVCPPLPISVGSPGLAITAVVTVVPTTLHESLR